MPIDQLTINGIDPRAQFGFVVSKPRGILHGPRIPLPLADDASRSRKVVTARSLPSEVREISIAGAIKGASASDVVTKAYAMKGWLYGAPAIALVTRHDDALEFTGGYCTAFECDAFYGSFQKDAAETLITLQFPNPLGRVITPTTSAAFTTATAMPIGSGTVQPVITVTRQSGTVTAFHLVLYDYNSVEVSRMVFGNTLSLGASSALEVDSELRLLTKIVSAVRSDATAHHVSGKFPVLDLRHASLAIPRSYSKLAVENVAGGTANAVAVYRQTER